MNQDELDAFPTGRLYTSVPMGVTESSFSKLKMTTTKKIEGASSEMDRYQQ